MLIVRAQLFASATERSTLACVSDVGGHMVLIRRGLGREARIQEFHRGVALSEALDAFARACRAEERRMGRGVNAQEPDARLERWLDRLAATGELPSTGRPRPHRSIPCLPPTLLEAPPPASSGIVWQVRSMVGVPACLLAPTIGRTVFALWNAEDAARVGSVCTTTSNTRLAPLLAGTGRLPRGTSIDGLVIEIGEHVPIFMALDLLRYGGEDLTGQPASTRLRLLQQLWDEMTVAGGVPSGWLLASTAISERPPEGSKVWSWRLLSAPYGAPGAWGFTRPTPEA